MNIHINAKGVITYILLFLCILNCNTIYSASATMDYRFPEFTALTLLLLIIGGYHKISVSVLKRWACYFAVYSIPVILLLVMSVDSQKYISFIVRFGVFVPLLALCILLEISNGKPWYYLLRFRDIVCVYALISIVMWLLVCQFHVIPQTGVCKSNWGIEYNYPTYFGIFTYRQKQTFAGIELIRNQGLFTEAPMYNLVLLLAILVELFINPLNENYHGTRILGGVSLKRLLVLVAADFTTFTTTGMILMIAMWALKYCLVRKKTSLGIFIKWIIGIGVVTAALFVINTLFLEKSTGGSWLVRSDDMLAGIKTWKQRPIIGTGYDSMDAIQNNYSSFRLYNMGYSSGFFSVLAQGGIIFMAIYLVGLLGYIRFGVKESSYELLASLLIILIIWVTTIFQNSFLMMLLLAYGYAMLISNSSADKFEVSKHRRKVGKAF